ncbi:UpsF protein [Sulfurisphaera tokodaii str. 7]|uniref:UpsF protein n=3 Tax=Sulfurisphaera tokodaii TaxID=111955 RepID=F9VP49_SULTO|nr:hypothetical protein [Sulfurisphaera tokodaii]BAK54557.1 UpsF protein [Sulfurisphaera tokodaii str. 7]HII73718.1 hypothetical protein [Sulfurisphaera tokodaii]
MLRMLLNKLNKISPCNVFNQKIKEYIEYYGDDYNKICSKYHYLLKIFILLLIAITILGMFLLRFLIFLDIPIGLIAYTYPLVYTWSRREEYKKTVNLEAPFITIIVYINSIVDKSLLYTFKELSEVKELKIPRIEYTFLNKMIEYMGFSYIKALEKRANLHRGDLLGKLYDNYLAALNLGITIKDRLRDVLKDVMYELKESYKTYIDKSAEIAEIQFALLLLLPIVLLGFAFTFKTSITELLLPLLFIPPLIFVISTIQPGVDYNIKHNKYIYSLIIIPIAIFIPVQIAFRLIIIFSVILFVSFFIYQQIQLANELEKSLPLLLKEIAEYLRLGYTVQNAIPRIKINSSKVNKVLSEILRQSNEISTPSKLFNMSMKVLFIISKSGSSSVALEELANAINEIVYAKQSLIRQLRLYDAMIILTPIMLWLAFGTLNKIVSSTLPAIDIIAAYSVGSVILFSKLSRFTLLYFPAILLLVVVLLILSFLPPVF